MIGNYRVEEIEGDWMSDYMPSFEDAMTVYVSVSKGKPKDTFKIVADMTARDLIELIVEHGEYIGGYGDADSDVWQYELDGERFDIETSKIDIDNTGDADPQDIIENATRFMDCPARSWYNANEDVTIDYLVDIGTIINGVQ